MSQKFNPGQPLPANSTYRNIVRISAGGPSIRILLTNEFGTRPLTIGAAHFALSAENGAIQAGSDHALTFSGDGVLVEASLQHEAKATAHSVRSCFVLLKQSRSEVPRFDMLALEDNPLEALFSRLWFVKIPTR